MDAKPTCVSVKCECRRLIGVQDLVGERAGCAAVRVDGNKPVNDRIGDWRTLDKKRRIGGAQEDGRMIVCVDNCI